MRRTVRWCWRRTVPALWALSVLGLVGLLGSVPPLAATPVGPAHAYNYDESAAVAPAAAIAHAPEAWDAIGAAGTTGRSTGVDGHVYDPARSFAAPSRPGSYASWGDEISDGARMVDQPLSALTTSQRRAVRSLQQRASEHQQKLADFIANPYAMTMLGASRTHRTRRFDRASLTGACAT